MTFDPAFEEFKRTRELERTRRKARGDEHDSDLHLPKTDEHKKIAPAPSDTTPRRRQRSRGSTTTRSINTFGL